MNCYTFVWDLMLVGETFSDQQAAEGPDSWGIEDFRRSAGVTLLETRGTWGGAVVVDFGRVNAVESPFDTGEPPTGIREIERGQWHRVVLTVDASAGELAAYVDGVKIFDDAELAAEEKPQFDRRFSLAVSGDGQDLPTIFGHSLFLGNEVSLAALTFLDVALPAEQVATLGRAKSGGILGPVFSTQLRIDALALPDSMTFGFDAYPEYHYVLERSADLCHWEMARELVSLRDERVQTEVEVDPEGKPAEFFRVRPVVD